MAIQVDFTNANDTPLPAGAYQVQIVKQEEKEAGPEAKNPGSKMILWTLEVTSPAEFAGRKLFTNTSLLPQALFALRNLLKAVDPENASKYDAQLDLEPEDYIGYECMVEVDETTYKDRPVNNIKKFLPLS